jgi:GMP synthase-like glutamine amidotransferase
MKILRQKDMVGALRDYVGSGKPFFGICLGLQLLFEGSEENGGFEGLGVIPGQVCGGGRGAAIQRFWPFSMCSSSSGRKVSGLTPTAVFALATPKSPIDRG